MTSGKVSARTAALVVAGLSLVLGAAVFGGGAAVLGVALGKGLWLGFWILAVVWPALLLYQLASRAGLDRIGELLGALFPNRYVKLLVLAWLLPSFVQGVAGFGTPIVVAAPLLMAAGWGKVRAVIYPLVGYHWAVTFGSMGSSFYVAALTAHLGPEATELFARDVSFLLGANALLAGAIVILLDGGLRGLREGAALLLSAGPAMAVTLYFVGPLVPAVASVAAGAAGLLVASGLAAIGRLRGTGAAIAGGASGPYGSGDGRRTGSASAGRGGAASRSAGGGRAAVGDGGSGASIRSIRAEAGVGDNWRQAAWVTAPYLYLVVAALAALSVPASRNWISSHFVIGPSFPATTTARGIHNEAVRAYTPLEIFGHPGTYLLLACVLGYATYRAVGLWPRPGSRQLAGDWFRSVQSFSISILALACVATVLRDTGMMVTLARGLVIVAGDFYPFLAAPVGAVGSFLTGSSASANALFATLQVQVADLIGVSPPALLAAQAAGANVGNILAPVVILIGLGAVGAQRQLAQVVRTVAPVALVLLAAVTGLTVLLAVTEFLPSGSG